AGYAITPLLRDGQSSQRVFRDVLAEIEEWLKRKGTLESTALPSRIRFKDGRTADYRFSRVDSPAGSLVEHKLNEPNPAGRFETRVAVGMQPDRLCVYVELGISSDPNLLQPIQFDPHCPQVLRDILDLDIDWYVGSTPVSTSPIHFQSKEDGSTL